MTQVELGDRGLLLLAKINSYLTCAHNEKNPPHTGKGEFKKRWRSFTKLPSPALLSLSEWAQLA